MIDRIINGDVLEIMKTIQDESVDIVITSPPYWQKRNYGFEGQWGLEPSVDKYINNLWSFMDEVWRILKPTGTVWINIGDTYGSWSGGMSQAVRSRDNKNCSAVNIKKLVANKKSLLMIPARFAIGCIERGWKLRNEIVWAKPNGLPESVKDRFATKHEMIYFFVKQQKYYFDLGSVKVETKGISCIRNKALESYGKLTGKFSGGKRDWISADGKNPGDVAMGDFWKIPVKASRKGHLAAYCYELIDTPIMAGCPAGGIVLDPFCGSGTTLRRAAELGRHFIGIDANEEYVKRSRIEVLNCEPELFVG